MQRNLLLSLQQIEGECYAGASGSMQGTAMQAEGPTRWESDRGRGAVKPAQGVAARGVRQGTDGVGQVPARSEDAGRPGGGGTGVPVGGGAARRGPSRRHGRGTRPVPEVRVAMRSVNRRPAPGTIHLGRTSTDSQAALRATAFMAPGVRDAAASHEALTGLLRPGASSTGRTGPPPFTPRTASVHEVPLLFRRDPRSGRRRTGRQPPLQPLALDIHVGQHPAEPLRQPPGGVAEQ